MLAPDWEDLLDEVVGSTIERVGFNVNGRMISEEFKFWTGRFCNWRASATCRMVGSLVLLME